MKRILILCIASAAPWLGGCGGNDGPQTVTVSGTVTLDGEPLEDGTIAFKDVAGTDKTWAGKITNGEYSFPSTVGQKRVEIEATKVTHQLSGGVPGTPGDPPSEQNPIVISTELVPPKYNRNSDLTANVSSEEREFNFELQSK